MKKTLILQSDIAKDSVCVMSTERFLYPVSIVSIVCPPEVGEFGWTELRVAIARKATLDISDWGQCDDITDSLFGLQKLYLAPYTLRINCSYRQTVLPFWIVLSVKNKTDAEHLYTFQVTVER